MEFTLEGIGGGAAQEMFDDALKEILENIKDPNTDWKTKRAITLNVTFQPGDETRTDAKIFLNIKKVIAPFKPFSSSVVIGRKNGKLLAKEIIQGEIFPDEQTKSGLSAVTKEE